MSIFPTRKRISWERASEEGIFTMANLVAFYLRADESYFGGAYRYITVGNTEKATKGAKVARSLAIHGSSVDSAGKAIESWCR